MSYNFVSPTKLRRPLRSASLGITCSLCLALSAGLSEEEEDEDVFELSPFAVEASEDVGYRATSTLAGTRVKTEMKDLANSITVATSEMMEDLNANDASAVLQFLGNTESGGIDGNFSGADTSSTFIDHADANRNPQNSNRIRGLARADNTRNFFPTNIAFDGYSIDRIDVNRGANSTLFGLGSPGGIINHQSSAPGWSNKNKISMNYGSFGTHRFNFNLNRVLLEDKLAVRAAGLYEQREWRQEPTYDRDKRVFLALTYKPFERGSLKVNYEKGVVDARRPRANAPLDTLTRWWEPQSIDSNTGERIVHDPSTTSFGTIDRDIIRAPGNWFGQTGVLYYGDSGEPDHAQLAWYNYDGYQNYLVSLTSGEQYYPSETAAANGIVDGSFWGNQEVVDTSIFDFVNHLIEGPNKNEWEDFDVFNISYDQNWVFDWGATGFELSYANEEMNRGWYDLFAGNRAYALQIDINTHLNDGSENPGFGQVFLAAPGQRRDLLNELETKRATGFFEFDLQHSDSKWVNWIGKQTTTLFAQDYQNDFRQLNSQNRMNEAYVQAINGTTDLNSGLGQARTIVHLGPDFSLLDTPVGSNIQPVTTQLLGGSTTGWSQSGGVFTTGIPGEVYDVRDDDVALRLIDGFTRNRSVTKSKAVVHQGKFFDGGIVATFGARNDKVENFDRNDFDRNELDMVSLSEITLNTSEVDQTFEADTKSLGLVLHLDEFVTLPDGMGISFHWGEAENFQIASPRQDMFGRAIAPPGGETTDQGVTISLFDGKLVSRFNWYESASTNVSFGIPNFLFETDRRIIAYNTPEELAAAGYEGPPEFYKTLTNWQIETGDTVNTISGYRVSQSGAPSLSDTQSTTSEGFELDLTYNPNRQWRFSFNAAQQKATRSNLGPAIKEYLDYRFDEWVNGAGKVLIADESGQTVDVRVFDTLLNSLNASFSRDGQSVPELAEWRWNFLANHKFADDSRLKGFNVGGLLSWTDSKAIGFSYIDVEQEDGSVIRGPDLENAWEDDSTYKLNLFVGYETELTRDVDWRIQLNLNNVLEDGTIVPVSVQPDGSTRSVVYREGITYNLRSTFSF
ncbi:TonB-dependent receptor plug domain-containing protein [Puniceicoccaceae bacterium K14]|nr:TonB-dependent receptor plug domain-containing protein [Puniceicoccaceae bacterium K14]